MPRRILYFLPVLLVGIAPQAHAITTLCQMQTGGSATTPISPSSPTENCNQPFSNISASLNWSSVIPATNPNYVETGSLTGSVGGDNFTVTSPDWFLGVDNTDLLWNGSHWEQAYLVNPNINTTGSQFNSTTQPTGPPPEGIDGDNLLGIMEPNGTSDSDTVATVTFQQTLSFVEFEVSDMNPNTVNFTADLIARSANGTVLGIYQVIDTGGGGSCTGLENTLQPRPCNDAPVLQFYSAQDNIASVELVMDDPTGAFIDTMSIGSSIGPGSAAPEPSSFLLTFGIGIFALLLWAGKRGKFNRLANLTNSTQD
jgi:hypothetical protein